MRNCVVVVTTQVRAKIVAVRMALMIMADNLLLLLPVVVLLMISLPHQK